MARTSVGILLWRRTPRGPEVLLAHPGGPFWRSKDDGAWTIIKGEPEPGEDERAGARREFGEETGADLEGELIFLGEVTQKGGKVVRGWAVEGDLDPASIRSNTFEIEWPPGTGRRERFPEIDRVAWFDAGVARKKINAAQAALIDAFERMVESGREPSADQSPSHP